MLIINCNRGFWAYNRLNFSSWVEQLVKTHNTAGIVMASVQLTHWLFVAADQQKIAVGQVRVGQPRPSHFEVWMQWVIPWQTVMSDERDVGC